MAQNRTQISDAGVADVLAAVTPGRRTRRRWTGSFGR